MIKTPFVVGGVYLRRDGRRAARLLAIGSRYLVFGFCGEDDGNTSLADQGNTTNRWLDGRLTSYSDGPEDFVIAAPPKARMKAWVQFGEHNTFYLSFLGPAFAREGLMNNVKSSPVGDPVPVESPEYSV